MSNLEMGRAASSPRSNEVAGDPRQVGRVYRTLSEAQRRTIAAIDHGQVFNAVSIAPRISTALRLERIGVIERGAHGLADARLTPLGRAIRSQLADGPEHGNA